MRPSSPNIPTDRPGRCRPASSDGRIASFSSRPTESALRTPHPRPWSASGDEPLLRPERRRRDVGRAGRGCHASARSSGYCRPTLPPRRLDFSRMPAAGRWKVQSLSRRISLFLFACSLNLAPFCETDCTNRDKNGRGPRQYNSERSNLFYFKKVFHGKGEESRPNPASTGRGSWLARKNEPKGSSPSARL